MKQILTLLFLVLFATTGYASDTLTITGTDASAITDNGDDTLTLVPTGSDMGTTVFTFSDAVANCNDTYGWSTAPSTYNLASDTQVIFIKRTFTCVDTAGSIGAYMQADATSDGVWAGTIYKADGDSGQPGTKMFETANQTIVAGSVAGFYDVDFTGFTGEAGDYWIGIWFKSGDINIYYEASTGDVKHKLASTLSSDLSSATFTDSTAERGIRVIFGD